MQFSSDLLSKINEEGVSIIIGARDEFPQIGLTIANLMEDCYTSGIEKFEIIIMDNGSSDETSRFWEWKVDEKIGAGTKYWKYVYSPRGMITKGRLRIFFDPVLSNVGTRNKGARKARYENIIFSDAHIIVRPGTTLAIADALTRYGGLIHAPIAWLGADCTDPQPGYQYSYKVGEKIWGTWNKIQLTDTPFYIPFCGHAFIGAKRTEFLKFRGYPEAQRVYGGGEPYLDTKWWMLGSHSMMDPRALVYHLSAGRGYSWHNIDLIHNMFLVSYILGGVKWADRIFITYLNKSPAYAPVYKMLYEESMDEGKKDYEWLMKNKKYDFEEVLALDKEAILRNLTPDEKKTFEADWYCKSCTKRGYTDPHCMRLWDYKNDELHGKHRSLVQEFALVKKEDGIYVGNTKITNPEAIEIASKYL